MRFEFQSRRVDAGHRPSAPLSFVTTEAQVNQSIAGKDINIDVADVTEAQLRGIHHYIRSCATGLDTSSIETALSAII